MQDGSIGAADMGACDRLHVGHEQPKGILSWNCRITALFRSCTLSTCWNWTVPICVPCSPARTRDNAGPRRQIKKLLIGLEIRGDFRIRVPTGAAGLPRERPSCHRGGGSQWAERPFALQKKLGDQPDMKLRPR
jgi:hypothetical protein